MAVIHPKVRGEHYLRNTWRNMMKRCYDQTSISYKNYGARGIKVCDRWHKFENWFEDMGDRPSGCSIDRIDPNKDYFPDNCRWATRLEQSNNRRNSCKLAHKGVTRSLSEWARELNIKLSTLQQRYYAYGWSVDKALSTPVRKRG